MAWLFRRFRVPLVVGAQLVLAAAHPAFSSTGLIARSDLFSESYSGATRTPAQISPDGKWIGYLSPDNGAADNVWVQRAEGKEPPRQVTRVVHGIGQFEWSVDSQRILYYSDDNGNEGYHLYSVNLEGGPARDLTPFRGARCSGIQQSWKKPGTLLAFVNATNPQLYDAYRVDEATGEATLDTRNPGDVMRFVADDDLVVRAATAFRVVDGATVVRTRSSATDIWRDLVVMPFEDSPFLGQVNGAGIIVSFSADGSHLYVASALHSDMTLLSEIDASTGVETRTIASDPTGTMLQANAERYIAILDPLTKQVLAVPFQYDIPRWTVVDDSVKSTFEYLRQAHRGVFSVDSQDLANRHWTVTYRSDVEPPQSFVLDRNTRSLRPLVSTSMRPNHHKFVPMHSLRIKARDGMSLLVYLTRPNADSWKPLPTVVLIHGGPWYRDEWGYSPIVQLLANRGYVVVQVQYRGSDGLGKRYLNAGTGQMGVRTDDDIADALAWLIREHVTDPARVAAMGYSFGGYHALRALTRHPELYSAGVLISGNFDLATSLEVIPEYWKPVLQRHIRRLGDVLHDARLNRSLSPLEQVDNMRSPLLIAAGQNDARNNIAESQRVVSAARARALPVTFVVYSDEGHFITRAENEQDLYGRIEDFLHRAIGGVNEPFQPVAGSSAALR